MRRHREGIVLLGLAALTTILFAATPLDLTAARLFFRPGEADPWPFAHRVPWSALYAAAPAITASLVLTGLAALGFGTLRGRDRLRRNGAFLLLSVVIGPGLVMNVLFKDHWGRPRPRDVTEFAGTCSYVPPLVPSRQGGASFPCGHCSVGFLFASGWWIWRRERPAWARLSLAAGIVAGSALGLGRMAAGGHFLSDIVWSALLALGIAHVLHDHVLQVPDSETETSTSPQRTRFQIALALAAALGGVGVLIALFGTPHGSPIAARIPLPVSPGSPWAFELSARLCNVDIELIDAAPEIEVAGELHGFGLPTSKLGTQVETIDAGIPTVRYRILQTGWFTDLDGSARVRIPIQGLTRLTVRVDRGDVRVIDRAASASEPRPELDLRTGYGRVVRPSPSLSPLKTPR